MWKVIYESRARTVTYNLQLSDPDQADIHMTPLLNNFLIILNIISCFEMLEVE